MVGCAIRNCKSRSVKGGTIRFFSFPTKESVAKEWLRYCGPNTTTKHARVCSNHFSQTDYIKSLQQVLLNYSPRTVRTLKPDAIPTLQVDSIDTQNTLNMTVAEFCEVVCTPDNVNCLSQCNTVPSNEVAGSSKDVEKSNETISVSVATNESLKTTTNKLHVLKNGTSDNSNCLSQCNTVPVNEVTGYSKVFEKSDETISVSLAEYGSLKTTVNEFYALKYKRNCLSQCNTVPANAVAGSSKVVEKSDITISVSLAEHQSLKKTADEFHALKNNLEKIFTPGQIRCLMKPVRRRIKWSEEDIAAAISLRSKSQKAYRHLKYTVGVPLPALSTLRKWVSKFKHNKYDL